MNGLKKSMLAGAMVALPIVAHAVKPLDDSTLGAVNGQGGVTIELQTKVTIGQFTHVDEGSFHINDITIGGIGSTTSNYFGIDWGSGVSSGELLDDLLITIDVASDGDAVIDLTPLGAGQAVDFKITTGAWELESADKSEKMTLVSAFNLEGLLFSANINIDTASDTMRLVADFAVSDMDIEADFLAFGLKNMQITGQNYNAFAPRVQDVPTTLDAIIGKSVNRQGVDALSMSIAKWDFDMTIGAVEIGGVSVGQMAFDNVRVANTSVVIYGH